MRRLTLILLLSLSACNTLKRFGPQSHPDRPPDPPPDIITITGVTLSDHDTIPIRTQDSTISTYILIPNTTTYRRLAVWEFSISPNSITFTNTCQYLIDPTTGKLEYVVITSSPSVPTGSTYQIRSILNSLDKSIIPQ